MNITNTVTLSDRYLRHAERLVEDGQFLSIEKVVEAGIDSLLRDDPLAAGPKDPLAGMADEIRRRMQTPRDQFIPMVRTIFSIESEPDSKRSTRPNNAALSARVSRVGRSRPHFDSRLH